MNGISATLSGPAPARSTSEGAQPGGPETAQAAGFATLLAAVLKPAPPRPVAAGGQEGAGVTQTDSNAEGGAGDGGAASVALAGAGPAGESSVGAVQWSGSHGLRAADLASPSAPSVPAAQTTVESVGPGAKPEESGPVGKARRGDRPRRVRGGDPDRVIRDVEMLDPEFRARMQRVVERMRDEFGHEVRVTETFREQGRQDHLYAQGRTRPGPVVTWTRSSNHTEGRAADVVIDGSYDNPAGYARLARVAREEGLRTLGARDPGHLELPRGAATAGFDPALAAAAEDMLSGDAPAPTPRTPAMPRVPAPAAQGVARVAEVARVADVASVAQVAAVAQVATPGRGVSLSRMSSVRPSDARVERVEVTGSPVTPAVKDEAAAATLPVRPAAEMVADTRRSAREELPAREAKEVPGAQAEPAARAESDPAALRGHAPSREPFPGGATAPAGPVAGADAASRVAQALEIRDGASAGRPLSSITLRMDDGQGGEDRIRVDLRGSAVDATLDVSRAAEAERLTARVGELHRALERQGLETEAVRIRAAIAPEAAAPARADTSSTPQRDRSGHTPHDEPRRGSEDPRQRSRRERKGGSKP